ncbi:trypsin-like peptidase domain-containing protein [Streptomyces sp. SD15]
MSYVGRIACTGGSCVTEVLINLLEAVTVRIESGRNASGTGFFIAPGIVLTASHVVTEDSCEVVWGSHRRPGTVLWRLPEHPPGRGTTNHPLPDLAAVSVLDPPPHPFAELDDDSSVWDGEPSLLRAVGYSLKYERESWQPEPYENETRGPVLIHGVPLLRITDTQLTPGMSGAPVLNLRTGRVCAVVKRSLPDSRDGGWAVLLHPYLHDRTSPLPACAGRSERWRAARRASIFPDLGEFLHVPVSEPGTLAQQYGTSWLLRPEAAIVPFHGREEWRQRLADWCDDGEEFSLMLLTGQGGCGKTRLALDVAADRGRRGWIAGFLDKRASAQGTARLAEDVRRLDQLGEPVLLVIDYAEGVDTLPDLLDLLAQQFIGPGGRTRPSADHTARRRLRILMLARHDGSWWRTILPRRLTHPALVGLVTRPTAVRPLNDLVDSPSGWHDEFRLALAAFARRRPGRIPVHAVLEIPPGDTPPVLQVHASALMAVLQADETQDGLQRVTAGADVIERLLIREGKYWDISAVVHAIPLPENRRRHAVALSVLLGADDEEQGTELIQLGLDLGELDSGFVAQWLAGLYPGDTSDVSRYWSPLRPDLVGEQLVAEEFAGKVQRTKRLLGAVPEARTRQLLTVLARAAQHHEKAHKLLRRVLREQPLDHLPTAIRLAPYAGNRLGLIIREVLDEIEVDDELLVAVLDALPMGPGDSVELASTWTFVLDRVDPDRLTPEMLVEQGQNFLTIGDTRQAVATFRHAVSGCEQQLREHPDRSTEQLTLACAGLGSALTLHGQQEEAESYCRRAVELSEQAEVVSLAQLSALLATVESLLAAIRWQEAENLADRVLDLLPQLENGGANEASRGLVLAVKAQIQLARGQVGRAKATAEAAYRALPPSVLADYDLYGGEIARVCGVGALVALCVGPEDEAARLTNEALRLLNWLDEHGVRSQNPLLALLLVLRAHQAHAAGDVPRARALSRRAAELAADRMEAGNHRAQILLAQALQALSLTGSSVPPSLVALLPRSDQGHGTTSADDPIGRIARETDQILGRGSAELLSRLLVLCAEAQHLASHDRAGAVLRAREALDLITAQGKVTDTPLPVETSELLAGLSRWTEPAPGAPATAWHEARDHARRCVTLRGQIADADPSTGPVAALLEERVQLARTEEGAGDGPEAARILDSAVHDAVMSMDPRPAALTEVILRALAAHAAVLERLGRTRPALAASERFQAYHQQAPDVLRTLNPAVIGAALVRRARLLAVLGRGAEAVAGLADAVRTEYFPPHGTGLAPPHAVDPMLYLVRLQLALGQVESAHDSAIRAEQVCRALVDRPGPLITALRLRGHVLQARGLAPAALDPLREALALARRTPSAGAEVPDTLGDLASALHAAGQAQAALEHFDALIDRHASADRPEREGAWRLLRARTHATLGSWDAAVRDCRTAIRLYGTRGPDREVRDALSALAYHLLGAGHPAEALDEANAAEAEARAVARGGTPDDVRRLWETMLIRAAILRETGADTGREEGAAAALRERHALAAGEFPDFVDRAVRACRDSYD